jgi:hypothetical protein
MTAFYESEEDQRKIDIALEAMRNLCGRLYDRDGVTGGQYSAAAIYSAVSALEGAGADREEARQFLVRCLAVGLKDWAELEKPPIDDCA